MDHLDMNRETESIQHQVWCLVSCMEEEMNLSLWGEKGGHRETVYKPGEGHRSSRHHCMPKSYWLQNKEARTKAACRESISKVREAVGNAQGHQGQVPDYAWSFPGDEKHRLLLRAVWERQRGKQAQSWHYQTVPGPKLRYEGESMLLIQAMQMKASSRPHQRKRRFRSCQRRLLNGPAEH